MKLFIISSISVFLSIMIIDGAWLTLTVSRFYRPHLGHLWVENISYLPAIALYLIYAVAVSLLLILPGMQLQYSLLKVFALGFCFGLAAYGCYDITNHATLKDWPWIVTIVDMLWGAILTGMASCIAFKVVGYFN